MTRTFANAGSMHELMIVCCALVSMCGCANRSRPANTVSDPAAPVLITQPAPLTTAPLQAAVLTTSGGSFRLLVVPGPNDIPKNKLFAFTVQVLSGDGSKPLTDIELAVDAAMPAHHHGMNTRPKVVANPDRTFAVRGMMLHMAGDWEIYFDVTRGGVTERAQMNVNLE